MVIVLCTKQESRAVWTRVFFNSHQQWAASPYASQFSVNIICLSNEQNLGLVDFHENTNSMRVHAQESMRVTTKAHDSWRFYLFLFDPGFNNSLIIVYVSPSGCNKSSAFYDLFIIATVLADSLTVLTNLFNSHQTWKTKRSYPNKYLGGGEFRWWTAELWKRWAVPGRVFESAWWKSWRITGKKKPLSLHALHAYSMFWSGLLQYQHIYLTGRGVWFRGVWFWWLQFSC